MDVLSLFNGFSAQIVLFVCWSALLYGVAVILHRFYPQLTQWARFWQAWLLLSLVPLVPVSFWHGAGLIPQVLIDSGTSHHRAENQTVGDFSELVFINYFNDMVFSILVLGMLLGVAKFVISLIQSYRLVKNTVRFNDDRINTATDIRVTEQQISPFVFGFFKPQIIISKHVLSMPDCQLNLLIQHELTHIKNRDPQAVILVRLIACLNWFNPFLRYMEQRFLQAMELDCDRQVLAHNPTQQLAYAQALVACLKLTNNKQDSGLHAYFSGARFQKQDFEQRIRAAMSSEVIRKNIKYYQLALMGLVSIMFTSILAAQPMVVQLDDVKQQQGLVPVPNARITSDYDEINRFRGKKPHKGIDFAASTGTDIVASFSGVIKVADDVTLHRNYGNVILIEHQGSIQSLYAHLDTIHVKAGDVVTAGQKIGTVGTTGRVTGPHLHFEMLSQEHRINPRIYLKL